MTRHLRLREFLAGLQGMALMRGLFTASDEDAQCRIDELRAIVAEPGDERFAAVIEVPSVDVVDGYEQWSTTYDSPGNPLISAEQ
jgi:hypothetical protein